MKRFDRKFGVDFIANLPTTPAVYLFKDEDERVVYVGKAKDIQRRLRSYRNASRRKVHKKMRDIVRVAVSVEIELKESERDALVRENELIQSLKPSFNVAGKYSFLYPAIGAQRTSARTLLCFTTAPDAWSGRGFTWYGAFPSRPRAKEAFDALAELLAMVGHVERTSALGPKPEGSFSRLVGVRQISAELFRALELLLAGRSREALPLLMVALLEKPRARREAEHVQALAKIVSAFYVQDLAPLRSALEASGDRGSFIPQDERDVLFIKHTTSDSS